VRPKVRAASAGRPGVIGERDGARAVFDDVEPADDRRNEVGGVRRLLDEAKDRFVARIVALFETAVRDRDEPLRHGEAELDGRLVMGMVETGKPEPRVLVLTLRPRLRFAIGAARVFADEPNAALRRPRIRDDERRLRAARKRALQADDEGLAVV
jgi:hypothetical protein